MDTRLAAAKAMFPEARRAVLYTPGKLAETTENVDLMQRIWREMAPCDVVVADIPWDLPDAAVNAFLQLAQRTSEG